MSSSHNLSTGIRPRRDRDRIRHPDRTSAGDSGSLEAHSGRSECRVVAHEHEPAACVRDVGPEKIERDFEGLRYGAFKTAVGDEVAEWLAPVRERYGELRGDEEALEGIIEAGADKARAIASATLADVRDAMGVGPVRRASLRPA